MEKPVPEMRVAELYFLREQDGPVERLLKQDLILLFNEHDGIQKAYLARVAFANMPEGVVLGIDSTTEPDMELLGKIQNIFTSEFNAAEHLDVLFLDADQGQRVDGVCLPFYQRRSGPSGDEERN